MIVSRLGGQGVKATLTRELDRFVERDERVVIEDRVGAYLFVSIHLG